MDNGRELSEKEWSDFFHKQLENIRREAAVDAESKEDDGVDPKDPYQGMPDPYGDDFGMPGVCL